MYAEILPKVVIQMWEAFGTQERSAMERAAHELKGIAGLIGAWSLAELASGLEKEARIGSRVEAASLEKLTSMTNSLEQSLNHFLASTKEEVR